MFEARLTEGIILKKIVESIKDLVTDVNFETNPTGTFHKYSYLAWLLPTYIYIYILWSNGRQMEKTLYVEYNIHRYFTAGYGLFPCGPGKSHAKYGRI